MGGFAGPPSNGGGSGSTLLGTVGGDLKGDITTAQHAVRTAMSSWQAPRAETFRAAPGGIHNIEEMKAAGLIDDRAASAWNDIDSGLLSRIQRGNTNLLYREQNQVINGQYDQMRHHDGPVGEAMTYLMTVAGSASIPGTKTPGEYSPWGFELGESTSVAGVGQHAKVSVKTPLPDFNVSVRDDRWDYVTHDTLPAYQKLLRENPEQAKRTVASDVDGRIDGQRLAHRWPKVAGDLLTDWDIDVDAGVDVGPIHIGF